MADPSGRSWRESLAALLTHEFQRGIKRFTFMIEALWEPVFWVLREEQENPLWFLIHPLLDHVDDDDHGYRLIYIAARQEHELVAAVSELLIDRGGAELLATAVRSVDQTTPGLTAR